MPVRSNVVSNVFTTVAVGGLLTGIFFGTERSKNDFNRAQLLNDFKADPMTGIHARARYGMDLIMASEPTLHEVTQQLEQKLETIDVGGTVQADYAKLEQIELEIADDKFNDKQSELLRYSVFSGLASILGLAGAVYIRRRPDNSAAVIEAELNRLEQ